MTNFELSITAEGRAPMCMSEGLISRSKPPATDMLRDLASATYPIDIKTHLGQFTIVFWALKATKDLDPAGCLWTSPSLFLGLSIQVFSVPCNINWFHPSQRSTGTNDLNLLLSSWHLINFIKVKVEPKSHILYLLLFLYYSVILTLFITLPVHVSKIGED